MSRKPTFYVSTYESICSKINWAELAEQKKALAVQMKSTTGRTSTQLNNLLLFIEKLQDSATDVYGVPIEEVHPIMTRIKLINQTKKNTN